MTAEDVKNAFEVYENPVDAAFLQRYFKTGPGQYAEGDIFIGIRVPKVRKIAKQFCEISVIEIEKLLESPVHEHRLCALIIMVSQFYKSDDLQQKQLYDLYLKRTDRINNWDLVDVSSRDIVGAYLLKKDRSILYKLAESKNIWERRIAIISTSRFIQESQFDDTYKLAKKLLNDKHDLIHKAVGWMLREAGKKDEDSLVEFLNIYAHKMPRTMLRYSLERLNPELRQKFMSQTVK